MTREEAIRCLSVHSSTNGSGLCTDEQHYEAKQMAIKALEQEPSGDLISKQAVLKIIDGWYENNLDTENIEDLIILITYMASVTPQPKTGHWIFQDITQGKRMWCSNCNSAFDLCCNQIKRYDETTKKEYLWGHCPWCGARMVEPQESEEV